MDIEKHLLDSAKMAVRDEIDRAVDKIKLGMIPAKRPNKLSRWYRKMWYINKWRNRNIRGPEVAND